MDHVGTTGKHDCPNCLKRRERSRISSQRHYVKHRQRILKGKFVKYHEKAIEKKDERGNSPRDKERDRERGTEEPENREELLPASSEEEGESGSE